MVIDMMIDVYRISWVEHHDSMPAQPFSPLIHEHQQRRMQREFVHIYLVFNLI